jgi:predicted alpha/beta hydrolase family esterase
MPRILIVPGLGGSGPEHWQTCLEGSLSGATRVEQDDWDRPVRDKWVARLADAVSQAPGAVLVAHSLGCIVVAHAVLQYPDLPIGAALLVAPADVDSAGHTPDHLRGFAPIPRGPLPFRAVVVASTNDPYMTFARAGELADAWDTEFVDAGPLGHINVAAGFGSWPAGEAIVRRLIADRHSSGPQEALCAYA